MSTANTIDFPPTADAPVSASSQPWWQPAIINYGAVEMFIMRALFAVVAYDMLPWGAFGVKSQKYPHGLARFFDLTWLAKTPPVPFWHYLTMAMLVPYVFGWIPAMGLAPVLFFALTLGSLVTSQSDMVNHTWQLISMIILAQWLVYAWPKKGSDLLRPSVQVHRLAMYATTVVIAGSYVVCGVSKIINSHFQWIQRVPDFSLQLMKSNWCGYYDALEQPPEWLTKVTDAIVEYPNLARLFFGSGLFIELFAFVILINRKWAFWGGLSIILMHLCISRVMNLHFEYHIYAALIFLVNVPGLKKTFGRQSRHQEAL